MELVGKTRDRGNNGAVVLAIVDAVDKGAIDFDSVDREIPEQIERGVPGSKIVHAHGDSVFSKLFEVLDGRCALLDQLPFRNFDIELRRRHVMGIQLSSYMLDEVGLK